MNEKINKVIQELKKDLKFYGNLIQEKKMLLQALEGLVKDSEISQADEEKAERLGEETQNQKEVE